jgi:urease accessory protein
LLLFHFLYPPPNMITVNKLISRGKGLAPALVKRAPSIELDWDVRQKSRFDATDSSGRSLGVFLPRGTAVRGGDVLVAEDGSLVRVIAAPQPVLVVRHCAEHGQPFDLLRAAYHLGNRHVQLQLSPDRLQLEPDHVLADLLRSMHLIVHEEMAAFEPEGGAYAAGGGHGHDHGHGHAHGHADVHAHQPGSAHAHGHDHDHEHEHEHEHGHEHVHGQGHAHDPGEPVQAHPQVLDHGHGNVREQEVPPDPQAARDPGGDSHRH